MVLRELSLMESPEIQGYEILAMIGAGSAGAVYKAKHEDGKVCAIKVFDSMASNVSLLGARVQRVQETGVARVVPVLAEALKSRPSCLVMPFLGDEGEVVAPRTLQTHFLTYQANEHSWGMVLALTESLAELHRARVAHGNLKPGNIFLGEAGEPLLADYASGFMPGVHRFGYSDALLYAPPEHLQNVEGYLDEKGYRWDVYAFGVLAYRLLTGVFPRCHDFYEGISPALGSQQRFEIDYDPQGLANALLGDVYYSWPEEARDEREARQRAVVDSCLALDPMLRPRDMGEVLQAFGVIDGDLAQEAEVLGLKEAREDADNQRDGARRKFRKVAMVALGLGVGWAGTQALRMYENHSSRKKFEAYRDDSVSTISGLESERDTAKGSEEVALKQQSVIQAKLDQEQAKSASELQAAHQAEDRLFDFLLEESVADFPTLQGREDRLVKLLSRVDAQLAEMANRPGLDTERSWLKLRRAELSFLNGDAAGGEPVLTEVLSSGKLSAESMLRARLSLLLLKSKSTPTEVESMISEVESVIAQVFEKKEGEFYTASSAVALAKARMNEALEKDQEALVAYQASLRFLKRLEDEQQEIPKIGLMVGRRYLAAANAAEEGGSVREAARLRDVAGEEFLKLASAQKRPSPELSYEIVSARTARALGLWQQGEVFEAEKLAREAVAKLTSLQTKLPADFRITVDLAAQKGIIATALRDEGRPKESRALLLDGIKSLETGLKSHEKNWSARYLLASLKWQLSGLMGLQGEGESELEMGAEAHDELKALLETPMLNPAPSEVRKSLAYLCGDLGHTADLRDQRDLAKAYLEESKLCWQILTKDEGNQLEFRKGYHWAAERLAEIGE